MGRHAGKSGVAADGRTVEVRIRLDPGTARRLGVAAAIRGVTPGAFVAWALVPHLSFELPELPDVALTAIRPAGGNGTAPGGTGPGRRGT